jgi:hypothetical protein
MGAAFFIQKNRSLKKGENYHGINTEYFNKSYSDLVRSP